MWLETKVLLFIWSLQWIQFVVCYSISNTWSLNKRTIIEILTFAYYFNVSHMALFFLLSPFALCGDTNDKFLMMNMQYRELSTFACFHWRHILRTTHDTNTHTHKHRSKQWQRQYIPCVWFDHAARALRRSFAKKNLTQTKCVLYGTWNNMKRWQNQLTSREKWEITCGVLGKFAEDALMYNIVRFALALHRLKRYISGVIAQ